MNKMYTIAALPGDCFNKEYTIFSFDILNEQPLALHFGTDSNNITTIIDLDKLGRSSSDMTFYGRHTADLFLDFLSSITLIQDWCATPLKHDIEYAQKHYGAEMTLRFV